MLPNICSTAISDSLPDPNFHGHQEAGLLQHIVIVARAVPCKLNTVWPARNVLPVGRRYFTASCSEHNRKMSKLRKPLSAASHLSSRSRKVCMEGDMQSAMTAL